MDDETRIAFGEINLRILHLERVLILGDGNMLPLAEIVRNLTRTVSEYIAQKDKEETRRRDDWAKLKWVIIGVVVPSFIIFIGQAIVFYIRIFPTLP
jgi:hypothetical protein